MAKCPNGVHAPSPACWPTCKSLRRQRCTNLRSLAEPTSSSLGLSCPTCGEHRTCRHWPMRQSTASALTYSTSPARSVPPPSTDTAMPPRHVLPNMGQPMLHSYDSQTVSYTHLTLPTL